MRSNNSQKKIKPWRIRKSQYVIKDRWIKLRSDECVTCEGVKIAPYYVLEYPDWVHMVVLDRKKRILITQQYRHGAMKIISELPCGTVEKKDKNPLAAAKRELMEETGYVGNFTLAGITSPNPATHTNNIYIYLVTHPIKSREAKMDFSEILKYNFMPLHKALQLINNKKFFQALHISSLFLGLKKAGIKLPIR